LARCAGGFALAMAAACSGGRGEAPGSGAAVPASVATSAIATVAAPAEPAVALPPPACKEEAADPGPWPRAEVGAAGIARAVAGSEGKTLGWLTQGMAGTGSARLRFLGTHVFDLLDKLGSEGGTSESEQRRMICAVLNAAALRGAPVVRIWGTLKRTGNSEEIEQARRLLGLLLDENARRARPLRFIVTLLNPQPGYGLPDPEVSLDEQKAAGWSAREVYLEGGWQRRGVGQLAERIERYREDAQIRTSPYVLAWELANELETHRAVAYGSLLGPEASKLRASFLVPAATLLAESFPQPIALGDLRGGLLGYASFAESVIQALPPAVRARLVWTSHVYVDHAIPAPGAGEARAAAEQGTRKLDRDLELARTFALPFVVGEVGQHVRGAKTTYCKGGARHDIAGLLAAVLAPDPDPQGRREIEAALFWGDGLCGLAVDAAAGRLVNVGAGGDSADLGPDEAAAREVLREARRWPRFVLR
jgi:hypothetical protein